MVGRRPQLCRAPVRRPLVTCLGARCERAAGEVTKAGQYARLGLYCTKLAQAVERGRRISFSRGWPRVEQVVPEWPLGLIYDKDSVGRDIEALTGDLVPVGGGWWVKWAYSPGNALCPCFFRPWPATAAARNGVGAVSSVI